jgi:hypothetical protein
VRPATTTDFGTEAPGGWRCRASSSTPWTVRRPGWRAQPEKSVPS